MNNQSDQLSDVRLDKWLWATRVFKTRSQAASACNAGHVKLAGQNLKPAHKVRIGEVFTVRIGELTRTVRVVGLLTQRVGAKVLSQYLEDLTPPAEYARARELNRQSAIYRPKGRGRPTKKERRLLQLMGFIPPPD
ncbi:MAG: RNA-binding S4 domain-containing protein [Verrucomicrobia bacterium]|nr:RNA-binding S4 domain-containing protein [Verrucomicrobiota bacterium]